jgi:predicted nucleic acid-binding protein
MILLDVGVWLAAVWGRHAHHPATADWFARQTDDLVFCRVTQMSLLRLLSNPAIMGDDAVDRSQAWRAFDQLWARPAGGRAGRTGRRLARDLGTRRQEPQAMDRRLPRRLRPGQRCHAGNPGHQAAQPLPLGTR